MAMSRKESKMFEGIRLYLKMRKITMRSIADCIGVDVRTLFRWFNSNSEEHRKQIIEAIEKIEGVGNDEEN